METWRHDTMSPTQTLYNTTRLNLPNPPTAAPKACWIMENSRLQVVLKVGQNRGERKKKALCSEATGGGEVCSYQDQKST
ncbi:hypothetical protein E2C01_009440 [Portunus trituberculatus]|uniref:Uncharacterized protein n=1 Tax=Portunus trituberculatus TaxID=210409 RepID=A0A5B7D3J7_PORTR|nr:hypothetical protein [Portunus trituberculatus]